MFRKTLFERMSDTARVRERPKSQLRERPAPKLAEKTAGPTKTA